MLISKSRKRPALIQPVQADHVYLDKVSVEEILAKILKRRTQSPIDKKLIPLDFPEKQSKHGH